MVFGGFFSLLFLVALFVLAVWVVLRVRNGGVVPQRARPSPLDIAKERYARGEIDRGEFEQLNEDLS
jgi:putative membrane protein